MTTPTSNTPWTVQFIVENSFIHEITEIKQMAKELSASTYQTIAPWRKTKDYMDRFIADIPLYYKVNSAEEKNRWKELESKLYLLKSCGEDFGTIGYDKIVALIEARRTFSEQLEQAKFPKLKTLNFIGIGCIGLSVFALGLKLTNNTGYLIHSAFAEITCAVLSKAYIELWKKYSFKPKLEKETKNLKKLARELYLYFNEKSSRPQDPLGSKQGKDSSLSKSKGQELAVYNP